MSNARSPREVCSTTMGTSGLMVRASLSRRRPDSSRRLACSSLIRLGPQTARPARLRPGRGRERLRQLLVAGVARLGLDDRREHGLAPQRLLGFGLQLGEDLGLLATRYAQVGLARDTPVREAVEHALPHFLRARAGQLRGDRDARLLDDRVQGRLAELALDALLVDLEQPPAEIPAQLLDAVVAGIDGEVLVDGRQLLELDLLDGYIQRGGTAGELLVGVVWREADLNRALVSRARSH